MPDESNLLPVLVDSSHTRMKALQDTFDDLRQTIICNICVRPMYEPYTIHCGHTFCYSCLVSWFERNRGNLTCPECRTRVKEQPAPSYTIRAMTRLLCHQPELLPDGETCDEHEIAQKEESLHVDRDKEDVLNGGLFRGCFRRRDRFHGPIRDEEDGVNRCQNCHWELLPEGICERCGANWHISTDVSSLWDSDEQSISSLPLYPREAGWPTPGYFDSHRVLDDFSEDYDSEGSDPETDLSGFIEDDLHDEAELRDDEHSSVLSSRSSSPSLYVRDDVGDITSVYEIDVAHYGDEDNEDVNSEQTNYWEDVEPRPGMRLDDHESGQSSDASGDEDLANPDYGSDQENDVNLDSTLIGDEYGSESDITTSIPNSTIQSDEQRNRKRRRVIDDDEDDDEDLVDSIPRTRRRLSRGRNRTSRMTEDSDGDSSTTINDQRPFQQLRRRYIPRNGCRTPNIQTTQPPIHRGAALRSAHRTFAQASHTTTPSIRRERFEDAHIRTVPPAMWNSHNGPESYSNFVHAWGAHGHESSGSQ